MTKQDLVDAISTQTGISKRDLAQWIGTHHSILSRYLIGARSLPLQAVQGLLFLYQQLSDLPPLPSAQPTEENKQQWKQRAADCREEWKALQGRYAAVQQNGQMAAKALQLLAELAADTVMLNPKKMRWLEEQRYQAEKLLAANDLAVQQKLVVQIALLEREAALYESLGNGVEPQGQKTGRPCWEVR